MRTLGRLTRDPLALTGLVIVGFLLLVVVAAPWIAPHDPNAVSPVDRLASPSGEHPLGTDVLGRDLLSRLLVGARWSLGAATLVTVSVVGIGVLVGTVSGYYGGVVDAVAMRVVDALLAFPALLLTLAIVGVLGPGLGSVLAGLIAVAWADYARIARGSVLALREREYVLASQALGGCGRHIVMRHMLPNIVSSVVVLATLEMGQLILALAGLSFLGLGAQPPDPEWGAMLNDGRLYFLTAPQLMIYPGIAISLAVLGLNLLGDGLRDLLDPRLARRIGVAATE
ncbi:MAG: nickel transporter permease [Acidimicrobiales bacterium]